MEYSKLRRYGKALAKRAYQQAESISTIKSTPGYNAPEAACTCKAVRSINSAFCCGLVI